jgi:hypothetical protein
MFEILQGFLIIFAVEFNHLRWDLGVIGFRKYARTIMQSPQSPTP